MKQKIFSLTLCIFILTGLIFSLPQSASAETEGYYTYEVSNGEATITKCDNSIEGDVTLPSTLGGYPVTSIGNGAFYRCEALTAISIPDTVLSIGEYAFGNCKNLTTVQIPNGVTKIEAFTFSDCYKLSALNIPDSVTSIGDYAFANCLKLSAIEIPNGVTSIGYSAFAMCKSLVSIKIPNGVTTIEDGVFYFCINLVLVELPDSITSIGKDAISVCNNLTSLEIPNSVTRIEDYAFRSTNLTDIYYPGTKEEWNAISIGSDNESLTDATIHFNTSYTPSPQLHVLLDGREISFDVQPQIVGGRTLVPLHAVFESMVGTTVTWDANSRSVLVETYGTEVRLTADEKMMYVNGEAIELEVAATIVDDRILVPVRAISESLNCTVAWDAKTQTVLITTPPLI